MVVTKVVEYMADRNCVLAVSLEEKEVMSPKSQSGIAVEEEASATGGGQGLMECCRRPCQACFLLHSLPHFILVSIHLSSL